MKILLAQINTTVGDINGNTRLIVQALKDGIRLKCSLVLFPEMAIPGYPPKDLCLLPHFVSKVENALLEIIPETKGISAIIGTLRYHHQKGEKELCNSAAIIEDGKLLGFQDKILLPTYDVFDERRFFEPGEKVQLWKLAGKNIAVTICEDIWQHSRALKYSSYTRDPIRELAALHPDLIVNLSASPYSITKLGHRFKACSLAAKTIHAPLLLCNSVGGNDSLIFDGSSLFVNAAGELVDHAKSFCEDNFLIDLEKIGSKSLFSNSSGLLNASKPRGWINRIQVYIKNINLDAIFHPRELSCNSRDRFNLKTGSKTYIAKTEEEKCAEIYSALVLGLKDYFHKLKFTKACLGLSGGIDSSLVACLAVDALGKENVLGVLMPSRYSSKGSISDALQLADALGIKTEELSIEGPFQSYLNLLHPIFQKTEEGSGVTGVTEENIQARIRGMLLMAFSNKFGYIVLSTGNKSELAMGYSTLYGDLCGGLAVISDVTKNQVYALSNWINRKREIIPKNSLSKPPSAELRPNQKDSDSLPDYSIIDNVLEAYLEEHLSSEGISKKFNYPIELVDDLIRKIHRNEYKRNQSPLGLKISEKALSVGRYFPIVHGF